MKQNIIKMEDILIIGSKDYKINLNNNLDKFEKNIRINGSLSNGKNGSKTDILYLNNHFYEKQSLQDLVIALPWKKKKYRFRQPKRQISYFFLLAFRS